MLREFCVSVGTMQLSASQVVARNLTRLPQLPGSSRRHDLHVGPPNLLVAASVQILVVRATEWRREFIAHLASK